MRIHRRRNAVIVARFINRCWSLFQWAVVLVIGAALLIGAYLYLRLDDEIRHHVQGLFAEHYRDLNVQVGGARFEKNRGITISNLTIGKSPGNASPVTLLSIDELLLAGPMRIEDVVSGTPAIDVVVVQRATLHATRQVGGGWDVKELIPLPSFSDQTPSLEIRDATLILDNDALMRRPPLILKGIDVKLSPKALEGPSKSLEKPALVLRGTASGIPAKKVQFAGEIDTKDGALAIRITIRDLDVTPAQIESLPLSLPEQIASLQLHGTADIDIVASKGPGSGTPLEWSVRLGLTRGRVEHSLLPSAVTELTAKVMATPERLFVEQLAGKLGTASVVLACQREGWRGDAPLGLALRVTELTLDERMREHLPQKMAKFWSRFQPSGSANISARIRYFEGCWNPHVNVTLRNATITDNERFPYVLDRTHGSLTYQPASATEEDSVAIDLTGYGRGRPVRIHGQFRGVAGNSLVDAAEEPFQGEHSVAVTARRIAGDEGVRTGPTGQLEVSGTAVPLHEELIRALPPEGEALVRSLDPQGNVDFRWHASWSGKPRADIRQDIQLNDCSIRYQKFRYPLTHINGLVTLTGGVWKLHGVESRGMNGVMRVVCHGESVPAPEGRKLDLVFQASDVPLDDHLRQALTPGAQQAWAEIRPVGRVDFTAHVTHSGGEAKPSIEVVARPRDGSVSIQPKSFDYRLEKLQGEASFIDGVVELKNVRAKHGRTGLSASRCKWSPADESGWRFSLEGLNADRVTLNRGDLVGALPPRLQKAMERLAPDGSFSVINSALTFEKRLGSNRIAAAWDVYLDCHQLHLRGTPFENISGAVRLQGRDDDEATSMVGELDIHSMIWKDLQFTNIRGPIWMDRSVCLFGRRATEKAGQPPRPLTCNAYGGSIAADASVQHEGTPRFQIEAALGGGDLNRFANERLGGLSRLTGTASGRLSINGSGGSLHTLDGKGELHIVDANIYELPLLVAMLKVLRNRTPDSTAFNKCDVEFTIAGEHIQFQKLDLTGDAVSLYGRGESDFDRNVELTFYALMGPVDLPIPLWRSVAGGLSEQGLQLKVVGKYNDPKIERHVLPAVDQMFQQIQAGVDTVVPSAAFRGEKDARIR